MKKININIAVDTVEALSKETLVNHIYVMDDSTFNSKGQGTGHLETTCQPGQVIHWVATAIDLQTPVCIRNISFLAPHTGEEKPSHPSPATCTMSELDLLTWSGTVPYYMEPGVHYRYRLELQIGNGKLSVMYVDTLSLIYEY